MRLSASINFFNGEEMLLAAVRNIRPLVQHLSIVSQSMSNWGNPMTDEARQVLKVIGDLGLADDLHEYSPDLSLPAWENEHRKRQAGLELARRAGASHFLLMDADEFYEAEAFGAAVRKIEREALSMTAVPSYFHIKKPTFRSARPDVTNVCFICKMDGLVFTLGQPFPVEHVDPTRRLCNTSGRFHLFGPDEIFMHHMNFVRRSFDSKLANTSSRSNTAFIEAARKALEGWVPGSRFRFPNKPEYDIEVVPNIFGIEDV